VINIARSEPKTKNELLQCIQKFWIEEMATEQCNIYIDHIYKVVPVCKSFFDEWKMVASQNALGEKLFFHFFFFSTAKYINTE
jgi:hypothetical protein